jgi:hypothetical protein
MRHVSACARSLIDCLSIGHARRRGGTARSAAAPRARSATGRLSFEHRRHRARRRDERNLAARRRARRAARACGPRRARRRALRRARVALAGGGRRRAVRDRRRAAAWHGETRGRSARALPAARRQRAVVRGDRRTHGARRPPLDRRRGDAAARADGPLAPEHASRRRAARLHVGESSRARPRVDRRSFHRFAARARARRAPALSRRRTCEPARARRRRVRPAHSLVGAGQAGLLAAARRPRAAGVATRGGRPRHPRRRALGALARDDRRAPPPPHADRVATRRGLARRGDQHRAQAGGGDRARRARWNAAAAGCGLDRRDGLGPRPSARGRTGGRRVAARSAGPARSARHRRGHRRVGARRRPVRRSHARPRLRARAARRLGSDRGAANGRRERDAR